MRGCGIRGMGIEKALEVVSRCDIGAFEFWRWWDKDLKRLMAARDHFDLQIAACCTKFISLVDPARRTEYMQGLRESVEVAKNLNCPTLISQVGDALPGVDRAAQHASLVEGLRAAAPIVEDAGITLVIEPLNELVDHPGYYLIHSQEAFDIVREVDSPRIQVVFDIYHQQISEGHLIHRITSNIDKIGHFHAAGNPDATNSESARSTSPKFSKPSNQRLMKDIWDSSIGLSSNPRRGCAGSAIGSLEQVAFCSSTLRVKSAAAQ